MIRLWLIRRVYSFLIGFILFSFSIPGAYGQNAAIGIDVIQPKTIRIGFFFSGENVKVYLLWTSEKLTSLEAGGGLKTMPLDYVSFLSGTLQSKNREAEPLFLNELIKLKEADGLYRIVEGTVHIKPLEKGVWDQADAVLELPSKIYPGTYALELIAFKEGKGRLLHSSSIVVELVGFPALVSSLALQKGLLYGILAVIIATFSGLLIGIVFTSKRGH